MVATKSAFPMLLFVHCNKLHAMQGPGDGLLPYPDGAESVGGGVTALLKKMEDIALGAAAVPGSPDYCGGDSSGG